MRSYCIFYLLFIPVLFQFNIPDAQINTGRYSIIKIIKTVSNGQTFTYAYSSYGRIQTVKYLLPSGMLQTPNSLELPAALLLLAKQKKTRWIEESLSKDGSLYRFPGPPENPSTSRVTFVSPFYDANGNVINPGTSYFTKYWWHENQGKFYRTQFRPGIR